MQYRDGDRIIYDDRNSQFITYDSCNFVDHVYDNKNNFINVGSDYINCYNKRITDLCLQNYTNNIIVLNENDNIAVYDNMSKQLLYNFDVIYALYMANSITADYITFACSNLRIYDEKGKIKAFYILPNTYGSFHYSKYMNLIFISQGKKIKMYDTRMKNYCNNIEFDTEICYITSHNDNIIVSDCYNLKSCSIKKQKERYYKNDSDYGEYSYDNSITDLCVWVDKLIIARHSGFQIIKLSKLI